MDFKNKIVLITGGAGGIGVALGRLFLEKGAKVCLSDVNVSQGEKVVNDLQKEFGEKNIIISKCDVTNDKDFEASFDACEKEFGKVDILCNNAGTASKDFKTSMEINVGGVVRGTEIGIKRMGKQNGGKGGFVINTASVLGISSSPVAPLYSASKAAVVLYTRDAGHEFHFDYNGVYVLCVCPGIVDTPLVSKENLIEGCYNSYTLKLLPQFQTSQRIRPRDVAEAFIKIIEDRQPGSVLVVEHGTKPYYIPPAIQSSLF
ncbi:UNVERIFIED_CONTAM: hypothetical protein RMT77_008517 [Armadillidium vulgare]